MSLFHRHDYKIVASQSVRLTFNGVPYDFETEILLRCTKCGKHTTRTLSGKWTLKELRDDH